MGDDALFEAEALEDILGCDGPLIERISDVIDEGGIDPMDGDSVADVEFEAAPGELTAENVVGDVVDVVQVDLPPSLADLVKRPWQTTKLYMKDVMDSGRLDYLQLYQGTACLTRPIPLPAPIDVDGASFADPTPLFYCVLRQNLAGLHYLLDPVARAGDTCGLQAGMTALHLAIRMRSVACVRELLMRVPKLASVRDSDSVAPIELAGKLGFPEAVRMLEVTLAAQDVPGPRCPLCKEPGAERCPVCPEAFCARHLRGHRHTRPGASQAPAKAQPAP